MDVAIVTCVELPEPDLDEEALMTALRAAGLRAELRAWDDPSVDWTEAPVSVLRSTWNYPLLPVEFVSWAERCAALTTLLNPFPVVRWNVHKRYLVELAEAGVPVAPTELVPRGSTRALVDVMRARGWEDVVVKPAISAGSLLTERVQPGDEVSGEAHLRALTANGDALVQRYLRSVEGYGERALVWIDGAFTHAVRKSPRFSGQEESVSEALSISVAERELAEQVLDRAPGCLYARVDVAPGPDEQLVLMELELIEPSLFLVQCPAAMDRLVRGIQRLCRG